MGEWEGVWSGGRGEGDNNYTYRYTATTRMCLGTRLSKVYMVLITSTKPIRLFRDWEKGVGSGYGGGGRGRLYTYRYTVTTRMTPALRWAAMRAILMFRSLRGTKSQDSVHKPQLVKRKDSRS